MKRKLFLCLLFILCALNAKAQYYDSGQDPANTHWRQIKTAYFQIIFPDFYEEKARYLARNLDSVCSAVKFSLPAKSTPIPLIIHPQSSVSNGLVVWAPKRMEWWSCSPQQTYHLPWYEQLSIHEYRHVVQMQHITEGVSGVLTDIFGEHITGAIVGLFVPTWFMEGDATATETSLSEVGRGRSADFQMELKAQVEDLGIYSYDKAAFGSYKDFVPNRYVLGYHLVSFGRVEYGFPVWESAMTTVARKLWLLNPFERGIKYVSGLNMNGFYKQSMSFYDSLWSAQPQTMPQNISHRLTLPSDIYTNYLSPKYANDSTVISLKNSLEKITHWVEVSHNGKEKRLRKTASVYNSDFDFYDGKVLWSGNTHHPRWGQVVYSQLYEFDFNQNEKNCLTKKKRNFSPRYIAGGKAILAVEDNTLNEHCLILLDKQGNEIRRSASFSKKTVSYPCSKGIDSLVYFVGVTLEGRGIYVFDWQSGADRLFFDMGNANLSFLTLRGDKLFFTSDFRGVSQVYALDIPSRTLFCLTSAKYGVQNYDINPTQTRMVYSTYSGKGYYLEECGLAFTEKVLQITEDSYPIADALSKMEKSQVVFNNLVPDSSFQVSKYNKWAHLLNFHSWAPIAIDPSQQTILGTGFSVISQNILSTSFMETGFIWNNEEGRGAFYMDYTYKGFFPIWTTNLGFKGRKVKSNDKDVTWNELTAGTRLRFPWSFNDENTLYGFSTSVSYEFKKIYPLQNYNSDVHENHLISLGASLYHEEIRAPRSILPQWGQSLSANFSESLNIGQNSWQISIYGRLFFPAFWPTHSFNLYAGYQHNKEGDFTFSSLVSMPRGYATMRTDNLFSNKLNYLLPLWYPDFPVWRILYMKRIYTNLFYDFMWYSEPGKNYQFNQSLGLELNFNIIFLRLEFPIDTGVRFSYMPDLKDYAFEFLFSISI